MVREMANWELQEKNTGAKNEINVLNNHSSGIRGNGLMQASRMRGIGWRNGARCGIVRGDLKREDDEGEK